MPELPEVETVRRGLERTVVGKTIASVDVRNPGQFRDGRHLIDQCLVGCSVQSVERRGKIILVHLTNEYVLAIHLKMTGQLVVKPREVPSSKSQVPNNLKAPISKSQTHPLGTGFIAGHPEKAYEQPLPHRHTHVIIRFTDGAVLYFNDLRKFGWLRLLPRSTNQELRSTGPTIVQFLAELKHGPEPLSDEFTADHLYRQAKKRSIPIKSFLLDQSVVAGIGNIYADEALFESKIRPTRKAKSLTRAEAKWLHAAMRHVLQLGIEHGGTTMNTYVNVEGTAGKMRKHLKVYDREGQSCVVCNTLIKRIKIGQRSSHFCPTCQSWNQN